MVISWHHGAAPPRRAATITLPAPRRFRPPAGYQARQSIATSGTTALSRVTRPHHWRHPATKRRDLVAQGTFSLPASGNTVSGIIGTPGQQGGTTLAGATNGDCTTRKAAPHQSVLPVECGPSWHIARHAPADTKTRDPIQAFSMLPRAPYSVICNSIALVNLSPATPRRCIDQIL